MCSLKNAFSHQKTSALLPPQPPPSYLASSAFGDTYLRNFMPSHCCLCPVPCQGPCFLIPPHLPAIYSTARSTFPSSQIIILLCCRRAAMETMCRHHCGVAELLNLSRCQSCILFFIVFLHVHELPCTLANMETFFSLSDLI